MITKLRETQAMCVCAGTLEEEMSCESGVWGEAKGHRRQVQTPVWRNCLRMAAQ